MILLIILCLTKLGRENENSRGTYFVIAWDSNINKFQWRIRVAESNNWDVHIRSLSDGLMIGPWVSDQQQSRLTEACLKNKK